MRITNGINQIENVYYNRTFSLAKWKIYIERIFPKSSSIFLEDIKDYNFNIQCLPILNGVLKEKNKVKDIKDMFNLITKDIESNVIDYFHKSMDVEIVLYLGLCNGAGWVTSINGQTKVLLGIEKIIELNWCDKKHMVGLIYHELGHVYQKQYGILDRKFDDSKDKFLWQLFTEGIAMYFEQALLGDFSFYHQGDGEWKQYLDNHLLDLKIDFTEDIEAMNHQNQRYFGDWVFYNGYSDAGYYLSAKFVQFICEYVDFNQVISFDIEKVKLYYRLFIAN